jgi:hypothetical protein
MSFAGDPLSHHSSSQPYSSVASQASNATALPPVSPVTTALHRLYISNGDLHRYLALADAPDPSAAAFGPAERQYEKAAKARPTNGNAYNQLAVLEQQKKQWFTALYMYAYSLMVPEAFETAQPNLNRMYRTAVREEYMKIQGTNTGLSTFLLSFT